ncbi:MAG: nucleoside hydrolase-like domain-containing protein, partial [Candidatus Cryptobacteroides sp.]
MKTIKPAFYALLAGAALCSACCNGAKQPEDLAPVVDKSSQARILITTDLEVDDMNGILLSLLYADQYDLAGIVWTAGMYHFSGDGGKHTLGEITPHYRCNAQHCEHRVKTAADLTEYRPVDPTWLGRVLDYYEEDYAYLSLNNPNY